MTDRILALDLADACGWAHSNGQSGTIALRASRSEPSENRLVRLETFIREKNSEFGIDTLAYEDAGFGGRNPRHSAMLAELRGIAKKVAGEIGAKLVPYNPSTVKAWTGHGRNDKEAIKVFCRRILHREPATDDEADALVILDMARHGFVQPRRAKRARKQKMRPARRLF